MRFGVHLCIILHEVSISLWTIVFMSQRFTCIREGIFDTLLKLADYLVTLLPTTYQIVHTRLWPAYDALFSICYDTHTLIPDED